MPRLATLFLATVVIASVVASPIGVAEPAGATRATPPLCDAGGDASSHGPVARYNADGDGFIGIRELATAATDHVNDDLSLGSLVKVTAAYADDEPEFPSLVGRDVSVTDVVDGETIEIAYENGTTDTVGLVGVDVPDTAETAPRAFEGIPDSEDGRDWLRAWGHNASEYVRRVAVGTSVTLCYDEQAGRRGASDRILAHVYLNHSHSLNEALVGDGYARVPTAREFERESVHLAAEARAQTDGVGLWAYVSDRGGHINAITATVPSEDLDRGNLTVSLRFTRTPNSTIFRYVSHDPVVAREPGDGSNGSASYYLVTHDPDNVKTLYRAATSGLPVTASRWQPITTRYTERHSLVGAIDTLERGEDRFVALEDDNVLTTDRIREPWTNNASIPVKDAGLYYENGTYHAFYEAGAIADHSGGKIGHVSNDGNVTDEGDWTIHDPVYTSPEGIGTGDYDVVETRGLYFVTGDYTADHPRYNVSVWVTDDLHGEFTRLGNVMSPLDTPAEIGVQDASILYNERRDRYVVFAHTHGDRNRWLVYATGTISVERTGG